MMNRTTVMELTKKLGEKKIISPHFQSPICMNNSIKYLPNKKTVPEKTQVHPT